jgi:hypothetical protein
MVGLDIPEAIDLVQGADPQNGKFGKPRNSGFGFDSPDAEAMPGIADSAVDVVGSEAMGGSQLVGIRPVLDELVGPADAFHGGPAVTVLQRLEDGAAKTPA